MCHSILLIVNNNIKIQKFEVLDNIGTQYTIIYIYVVTSNVVTS